MFGSSSGGLLECCHTKGAKIYYNVSKGGGEVDKVCYSVKPVLE